MTNDIATEVLKRVMKWMVVVLLSIAVGYFWCYKALADYEAPVKAGWVASASIKAAMQRMGPRYNYMMRGEKLYVDTGAGWKRLRYREGE